MRCTMCSCAIARSLHVFSLSIMGLKLFDGMATREKHHGAELQDGQGRVVRVSVVEFILAVLESQFPVHE